MQQKHLPRKNTEKTEAETEAFATDEHGITRKRQKQGHGRKNIRRSLKHGNLMHALRF